MTIDIENTEWPEDGKLLEMVGKGNPFTVPAGYFEGVEERVLSAIKMDELKSSVSETGFTVPGNYFEDLSANIQARVNIEQIISNEDSVFSVPAGYFEELSGNIQSRIAVEELTEEGEGFEVPADYFENLSSQIQSRIFVEELLTEEEVFSVPDGYFEQLNAKILNKTVTQDAVQRKGGIIRMIRSTAFKYATAACFILVAGGSIMFWPSATSSEDHSTSYLHQELSNVPLDELQGYIEVNMEGADIQHTVAIEELPVKDAEFNAALQEYVEMQ